MVQYINNNMSYNTLFKEVVKLIPKEIDISDGIIAGKNNSGFYFKKLSQLWDIVEKKASNSSQDLLIDSIFTVLHNKCKISRNKGNNIYIYDLDSNDLEEIKKSFFETLNIKENVDWLNDFNNFYKDFLMNSLIAYI